MPKMEIDVDQVLTAAVGITCEPGDRLIVMNGVVVGVERQERQPHKQLEAPKPKREIHEITAYAVLEHLKKVGPVTARTIGDHWQLEAPGRRVLTQIIRTARERLRLIQKENNSRLARYVPTDYGNETGGHA